MCDKHNNGCHSRYVGQTARHVITRLGEHRRKSSPLGRHFGECAVKTGEVTATVLDRCTNVNKLLTMEALYIARTRPILNQREGYRSRGKWSLGLMPFGLKSFGLIQLVTWLNFFKLSVSGIGHLA